MEEAPENGKELWHSAHAKGMNKFLRKSRDLFTLGRLNMNMEEVRSFELSENIYSTTRETSQTSLTSQSYNADRLFTP
jgi:hypothetical protein